MGITRWVEQIQGPAGPSMAEMKRRQRRAEWEIKLEQALLLGRARALRQGTRKLSWDEARRIVEARGGRMPPRPGQNVPERRTTGRGGDYPCETGIEVR